VSGEAEHLETRRYGRAAGLLSAGIALGGLLIYAYFGLASHSLTPEEYGEIVVLWSSIVVVVSILFRPIEQLLARTVAEAQARGGSDGHAIRVAGTIAAAFAVTFLAAGLIAREPLENHLFSGDSTLYRVFLAGVLVYGLDFFTRGVVAGRGQFQLYATLLIAYGVMFVAFAGVVAADAGPGFHFLAVGIAASPLVGLAIVLVALAAEARSRRRAPPPDAYGPGSIRATLASGTGFAAAVLLVMLSEQVLVNAGPLMVRATEDAALAGFVFNVLMVARAPIALFQGIAASLLPTLARLRSRAEPADLKAFSTSVQGTIRAVAAAALLTGVVMLTAGPELMQAAFGDSFDYDRADLVLVTGGLGLYLTAATLNQAALARGQARTAAAIWVGTALAFLAFNALPILDAALRVELGFAGGAAVLCAALLAVYRRPDPGRGEGLEPGSPQELQATLAAAEEGG
jgi:O-antigen/teichoic acid export membrane protein